MHIRIVETAFIAVLLLSVLAGGCVPAQDRWAIHKGKQALEKRDKNAEELDVVRGRLKRVVETKLKAARLLENVDRVLGRKYLEVGNYALAEEVLLEAETLKPMSAYLKMDLGECTYFLGMSTVDENKRSEYFARSRRYFEKALELDPELEEARYGYGLLLFFAFGDSAGAIREMKRLLENRPGHVEAHFALGRFYYELGDMNKALGEYLDLTRILPKGSSRKKKAEENIERIHRELGRG